MILVNVERPNAHHPVEIARSKCIQYYHKMCSYLHLLKTEKDEGLLKLYIEDMLLDMEIFFFDKNVEKDMIIKFEQDTFIKFTFFEVDDFILFEYDEDGFRVKTTILRESERIKEIKEIFRKQLEPKMIKEMEGVS